MTLRTLNYGNYGVFLIMGNAGFRPSAVLLMPVLFSISKIAKGVWGLRLFGVRGYEVFASGP